MDIIELFSRPGTYVLGMAIFVATFFTRRITEILAPTLKKKADANAEGVTYQTTMARWWNEVILYALPVAYGCLAGVINSNFFFAGIDGRGSKVAFSGIVGWFASFLYKAFRKVVKQRLGIDPVPSPHSIKPDSPTM